MFKRITALFCFLPLLAGCTSVNVQPVDASANLRHVCIENNSKVEVDDFVSVVQDGFGRHGITTQVYSNTKPANCEFTLTYTALRSWDGVTYLSKAELHLHRTGKEVAAAEYHLKGKGGLSLMKYQSVKTKMDPVIDELLKNY